MDLDLTPSQSRDLATTGRVEVWERMEPQPFDRGPIPGFSKHDWCWNSPPHQIDKTKPSMASWIRTDEFLEALAKHAPHPPGTRARVREPISLNHSIHYSHSTPSGTVGLIYRASWATDFDHYGRPFVDERRWLTAEEMPDWAIRSEAVAISCTPERRDEWGWVTVWETERRQA